MMEDSSVNPVPGIESGGLPGQPSTPSETPFGTLHPVLYPRTRPYRILVVDDVVENVQVIADCLEIHGFETIPAYNGDEAVACWETDGPDLILLDIMMPPGPSGIEVCRTIRSRQRPDQFTPILLVTALQDLSSKTQGLEAGAEDFIAKPFEPDELIARVKAHLRAKSLHDRLLQANAALEEEREKIARMQLHLLPERLPCVPGLRVTARYLACDRIGGDYYDVFRMCPSRYGFAVADVSGHGTPAAVVMSAVKALLYARPCSEDDPGATLAWLNDELVRVIKTDDFVTMFFGVYDIDTRELRFASAGHHPAALVRRGESEPRPLVNETGFPLAVESTNPVDTGSIRLRSGDRILFYTDGISEAIDTERRMYGGERLCRTFFRLANQVPELEQMADALLTDLRHFTRGAPLRDDITLLFLEVEDDGEV